MTSPTLPLRAIGPAQRLILNPRELRAGDVVHCHGLECLVSQAPTLSQSHAGGRTYWARTLVTNRAEVPADVVPYGFTSARRSSGEPEGSHYWTVQGNDHAWLCVDRAPVVHA